MAFVDFPEPRPAVTLLQRSLERGRLGHAYLFAGSRLAELEPLARTLAKTLNCLAPPKRAAAGLPLDCCDHCPSCVKIEGQNHADVQWVRPESKSRVVTVDQMRDLMETVHLKPAEADFKVAIVVAADRLNIQAANAFLKTLEEPPPKSVLILLTTEPERVLETIRSRCLRLNFAGGAAWRVDPGSLAWLRSFAQAATDANSASILGRYRLLGVLLAELAKVRSQVEETLSNSSPLERYAEADPEWRERWEQELAAAVEAEYRSRRADLLAGLQCWLRDVWVRTLHLGEDLLWLPDLAASAMPVAQRISSTDALENLRIIERAQWLLGSNVQEALALEVSLLKLRL